VATPKLQESTEQLSVLLITFAVTRQRRSMRSLILWAIGVPIPVIIILWLLFGGP
jgi:hypothetical protein